MAACAVVLAALLPSIVSAQDPYLYSQLITAEGSAQTQFNILLNGNLTNEIDNTINPFGAGGSVSVTYKSVSNITFVTFSGGAIAIGSNVVVGLSDPLTNADQLYREYWSAQDNAPLPTPSFFNTNPTSGPNSVFVITYSTFQLAHGAQQVAEWSEQQVPAGQTFQVGIGNNDAIDGSELAFNTGFQFSNTQIPLDDLNLQDYPPSSFAPLPGITNGISIASGTSVESDSLLAPEIPEPSSFLLCIVALTAISFLTHRRYRTGTIN